MFVSLSDKTFCRMHLCPISAMKVDLMPYCDLYELKITFCLSPQFETLLYFLRIPNQIIYCSILHTLNAISCSSVPLSRFKIKLINIFISHVVINTTLHGTGAWIKSISKNKEQKSVWSFRCLCIGNFLALCS